MSQAEKNLEYLMHVLRNGTTEIEGHLRGIETTCRGMRKAVETFLIMKEENDGEQKED